MVLAAVVQVQTIINVSGLTFTSASSTPTSSSMYLVFTVARFNAGGTQVHSAPVITGTNGFNTTWTHVPRSQVTYNNLTGSGKVTSGTNASWGIASSGTAGTITATYTNADSTYLCGTLHVMRIDGGPSTTVPIGYTGTAASSSAATVTATLTGTPLSTSIVIAVAATDLTSGTLTPSTGYATLGSMQIAAAGNSQPEFDEAPTSTTVGGTFSGSDQCCISAVEIGQSESGTFASPPPTYEPVPAIPRGRSM